MRVVKQLVHAADRKVLTEKVAELFLHCKNVIFKCL